jgi:predicted TIM-barrel fold metal-dependent hydrolase
VDVDQGVGAHGFEAGDIGRDERGAPGVLGRGDLPGPACESGLVEHGISFSNWRAARIVAHPTGHRRPRAPPWDHRRDPGYARSATSIRGEATMAIPRIISVDDHVVEHPRVWLDRLPAKYHDVAPRVVRRKIAGPALTRNPQLVADDADGRWGDVWFYEDIIFPLAGGLAQIGTVRDQGLSQSPVTYDEIERGCWDQAARLADMDRNHTEASLCFPTIPRFAGHFFLGRHDLDLALLCVQAFNDFMIDEWCAGNGYGRLIPLTIVPLWDPELAAAEIRRCADKGSHAIAFTECPSDLGLPSLYTDHWDPFLRACEETGTVINTHVGSSAKTHATIDAPFTVHSVLFFVNNAIGLTDWLTSGALERFPDLRISLSEGQVGWMPYLLARLDDIWERAGNYESELRDLVPERPSSYVPGRIYGCLYDDPVGLALRDRIGMGQLLFETDYPHAESRFPDSGLLAEKLVTEAGLSEHETWQLLRGNAIGLYGLERYGITE